MYDKKKRTIADQPPVIAKSLAIFSGLQLSALIHTLKSNFKLFLIKIFIQFSQGATYFQMPIIHFMPTENYERKEENYK